jgi:LacI family transcriptional regulator
LTMHFSEYQPELERMKHIALIIENSRGFGRALLRGIAKYAATNNVKWSFYNTPVFYLDSLRKRINTLAAEIIKWHAHGIIMRDLPGTEKLLSLKIPIILSTYRNQQPPAGIYEIYVDNYAIGEMAAEHLLERGLKKFAFCGFDEFFWSQDRGRGFSDRVAKAGVFVNFYKRPKSKRQRSQREEQKVIFKWLKTLPHVTGLMACIDERAQDVVEACKTLKINIPNEIALISGDNDELICELSNPRISSVAINGLEAGYLAAKMLNRLMSGQNVSETKIIVKPTHVVVRDSSDVVAVKDPMVSDAARFIREHTSEPIQVQDVVNAGTVSRRVLEQHFKQALNCSIYEEIKRVRLNLIIKMLLETDLNISEIAAKTGFDTGDKLYRFFRQEKGMNPLSFRKNAQGLYK